MRQGTVYQRHLAACPRGANGRLMAHRCRGSWGFVLDAGRRPDGKRRQITRSGYPTKRAAQAALQEEMSRQQAGLADIHDLTVATYLSDWLDGKRRLRDTTRRGYEIHIRRYLAPSLGCYRLADLRPPHIDQLYSDLLAGRYVGATATTVHHVHRTLRSALNTAVKQRLIPWNPALHVELPERRRTPTGFWTPEQVGRFLDHAVEHRLYALFHLIAFTGMRRGESLGLHWADLDLPARHLVVACQVVDAGQGPTLGAPKTQSGNRFVPIDGLTAEVLQGHRDRQAEERARWGDAWQDNGLVFTRADGSMLRPDAISRLFSELVDAAGLPRIRLHDLRHTHATLALAAGVDMKVVSSRLGHSTTAITADLYTHVIPALARQAADAIAHVVGPAGQFRMRDVSEKLASDRPVETDPDPPRCIAAGQRQSRRGDSNP
jgi:integrase